MVLEAEDLNAEVVFKLKFHLVAMQFVYFRVP